MLRKRQRRCRRTSAGRAVSVRRRILLRFTKSTTAGSLRALYSHHGEWRGGRWANWAKLRTRLPDYAPDLNPVEYLWAWLKRHALANFCLNDLAELKHTARCRLKSGRKRKSIIAACRKQVEPW